MNNLETARYAAGSYIGKPKLLAGLLGWKRFPRKLKAAIWGRA